MRRRRIAAFLMECGAPGVTLPQRLADACKRHDLPAARALLGEAALGGVNLEALLNGPVAGLDSHWCTLLGHALGSLTSESPFVGRIGRPDEAPLDDVAYRNLVDLVQLLLSRGARRDAVVAPRSPGSLLLKCYSPVHLAAFKGLLWVVQALVEFDAGEGLGGHGAVGVGSTDDPGEGSNDDPLRLRSSRDDGACTPLHYAAMQHRTEVVRYLLARGARADDEVLCGHQVIGPPPLTS